MLNYMKDGGSIMWIIASLSLIALAVAAERLLFFRKASGEPKKIESAFAKAIKESGATSLPAPESSLSRLLSEALSQWKIGREDMKLLTDEAIRREIYRWEKHLFILEITGRLAPLLGLLGTVLGMVEMFGSLHAGGRISAEAVTGGIWKALYTTVAGLSVAIPDIFIHGLLSARIDSEEEKLQRGAALALRLHSESQP